MGHQDAFSANQFRFKKGGHVESYFLRANSKDEKRALWLKFTVFMSKKGERLAELWLLVFDAEKGRVFSKRESFPFSEAQILEVGEGLELSLGTWHWRLSEEGFLRGKMRDKGLEASFALRFSPLSKDIGRPLSILPKPLLSLPFPKSKLLTPFPALLFQGELRVFQESWDLGGWTGMQGHNWGKEHAYEYAWGQCLFPAEGERPDLMVEAFSARVKVLGVLTPRMSALVLRYGEKEYVFNRIFNTWRQKASLDLAHWDLKLQDKDRKVHLRMEVGDAPVLCLGYKNPNEKMSYCFNTKLAKVALSLETKEGLLFSVKSPHVGAYELLKREKEEGYPVV